MSDDRKTDIEESIEQLLEDPDSPDKADPTPPQTIDAEPSRPDKDAR